MKASVELRNPYLDLDLVKFVLNLPLGYRYEQKGESVQLKALLKELAIEKFGSLLNVRKEGTRNFSMTISDAKYWNIQNFSLNNIFPIDKNNLNRKLLFRLVCLELFHRNFILQENAFLPVLLTDEGRATLL